MLLIALTLCIAQAPQVTGLQAGESVTVVDPSVIRSKDDRHEFIRPRVLDALTGAPIEGVRIETWTENGMPPSCSQMRLDVATTGRDGFARVCLFDGAMRGSKVRFSKSGYASYENSVYDEEVRMYPARTLEGRVLDLEGHPVMGAIVRTHYTCAHAMPASEVHTDALGRFRMEDFPPFSPEVEIVDMHHEPLFQRESADWWTQASFYGQLDFYVARRRPIEMQLVDLSGEPLPGRFVIHTEAPSSGTWTDENGLCTLLPPTHPFMDFPYEILDSSHRGQAYEPLLVDGLVTRTSIIDSSRLEPPTGRVFVHLDGLGGLAAPKVIIAPEKGRFDELGTEDDSPAPLGPARIVVGGAFTGFLQESRDVVITTDVQHVDIKLRREPRLHVHMVDPDRTRVVVQAGDDSVEAPTDDIAREGNMCEQGVPPGVPIAILWELDDGGLRRVLLPPIDKDTDVDLEAESSILRHGMSESAPLMTHMQFLVTDPAGKPLADATGGVNPEAQPQDHKAPAAGSFDWALPAHGHYAITFEAPGCTSASMELVVPAKAPDQPTHIVLTRRARLEISGKVTLIDGYMGGSNATDGGIVMDVAAGPLTLVLARENQPPIALDLVLAPGESRRIEVH